MSRAPRRPRFRLPFLADRHEEEVDEELSFHIEMRTRRLMEGGMDPEAARREALRRFGSVNQVRRRLLKEGIRDARIRMGIQSMEDGMRGMARTLRSLARTPGLTGAALTILTLGIGAAMAAYAVLHTVLVRPLPFADPDRVMQVEMAGPSGSWSSLVSPGLVLQWGELTGVDVVAGLAGTAKTLGRDDVPLRVEGYAAAAEIWSILDVTPQLGRTFTTDDDVPGAQPVVVLGHGLWSDVLGGDPAILGTPIILDGTPTTVVGILPPEAQLLQGEGDYWIPLQLEPGQRENVGSRYLSALVLLPEGVAPSSGSALLRRVVEAAGLRDRETGDPLDVGLTPYAEILTRPLRTPLLLLLGSVLTVVLIGAGNVATLLLARSSGRRRELAIRMALGAGRGRVIREIFLESAVLGSVAAVLATGAAHWGVRLLKDLTPFPVPRLHQATVDAPVVLFGVALTFGVLILASLWPAVRSGRLEVRSTLNEGEGSTRGGTGSRDRSRSVFLTLQVALSLALLVGAGLLARTAANLSSVEKGYDDRGVLTGRVALPSTRYPDLASVLDRYGEMEAALAGLANVEAVALGSRIPMAGGWLGYDFTVAGEVEAPTVQTRLRIVGSGFFSTLGTPLLQGREFSEGDRGDAPPRVVVNRTLARELGLDARTAVGTRLYAPGSGPFADEAGDPLLWEIVGVVEDSRQQGPRMEPEPELFFALHQAPPQPWDWLGRQLVLVLRTSRDPQSLAVPMQQAVRALDPELPVFDILSLPARAREATAAERFAALILAAMSVLGIVLAATGIFAGVAYGARRRTREIGIRMALGARGPGVVRGMVAQALVPVAVGIALGIPLSFLAGRAVASLLFQVAPGDLLTTLGSILVLAGVGAVAAYGPARRAARVDPVEALRTD